MIRPTVFEMFSFKTTNWLQPLIDAQGPSRLRASDILMTDGGEVIKGYKTAWLCRSEGEIEAEVTLVWRVSAVRSKPIVFTKGLIFTFTDGDLRRLCASLCRRSIKSSWEHKGTMETFRTERADSSDCSQCLWILDLQQETVIKKEKRDVLFGVHAAHLGADRQLLITKRYRDKNRLTEQMTTCWSCSLRLNKHVTESLLWEINQ